MTTTNEGRGAAQRCGGHGRAGHHLMASGPRPWWRRVSGAFFLAFLAIAVFFLLAEHTAHVFGALPYLLLLSCPLLHWLMHRGGHGGSHGGHVGHDETQSASDFQQGGS